MRKAAYLFVALLLIAVVHANPHLPVIPPPSPTPAFTYSKAAAFSAVMLSGYPGGFLDGSTIPIAIDIQSLAFGRWLTIRRNNDLKSPGGFHPCYTTLRSKYEPVVTRNADGSYTIEFAGEEISK